MAMSLNGGKTKNVDLFNAAKKLDQAQRVLGEFEDLVPTVTGALRKLQKAQRREFSSVEDLTRLLTSARDDLAVALDTINTMTVEALAGNGLSSSYIPVPPAEGTAA